MEHPAQVGTAAASFPSRMDVACTVRAVRCEEVGKDADLTTNESLAQLMEAFLSVRGLRIERGVELDRYYLGNFGVSDAAILSSRQIDADVVPKSSGRS